MVCVFTGPRKKNKPDVQALNGTEIVISTLWPGAKAPLTGLKPIFPGTFVKADHFRLLWLLDGESTRAKQINFPFF